MTTLIVDYGLCNLDSVSRALSRCGAEPRVSADPGQASRATRIVLPGVGNFADAAQRLERAGWHEALSEEVSNGVPLLGICLGMQLLATTGEEGGMESRGLGLVPGHIARLTVADPTERIPHVGWNTVASQDATLFSQMPSACDFYFVHSYHMKLNDTSHAIGTTPGYGTFVSAVRNGHVFGVQFHPEKSQRAGLQLLTNFSQYVPPR